MCIFCKIIQGSIPCVKIAETAFSLAFMDINPLSKYHILVIPKFHAVKMNELPPESLADILPLAARVINAIKSVHKADFDYNILQNNGKLAHQEVEHVHFHLIPRFNSEDGLELKWKTKTIDKNALIEQAQEIANALLQ